jgi:hypothetical protein
MKHLRIIVLILAGSALSVAFSRAEILQSAEKSGSLWAVSDGAETRFGMVKGGEIQVELPPGATIRDLEPTADGWLAAGHLPSTGGTELLLIEGSKDGADLLPVPERTSGRYRGQPVILLEDQRLVGLAWAEGNGAREFEIWASVWQDGEWGGSELVSPKGPGSQVAPVGAVLEDGSWLLVWTAFDGNDDEIMASRRIGGHWTLPGPIHSVNEVFDHSPDVVAVKGGALVVWSWYDGNDYRMKSARWLDGLWQEGEVFGGKGSSDPGLTRSGDSILLLYQSVVPASWTVMELDGAGVPVRAAAVPEGTNDRPMLLVEESGDHRLRWPTGEHVLEWQGLP